MNKKISLLLFSLLLGTQLICAKSHKKLSKKNDFIARSMMAKRCFDAVEPICCKRGKRGDKGRRGSRGISAAGGMNEIFVNGIMMSPLGTFIRSPYSVNIDMSASIMGSSTGDPYYRQPIGFNFNVPIDLDRTKPVTVVVHMFLTGDPNQTGDQAKIQVNVDYKATNQLLGSTPPATGFSDMQLSQDFTVTLATPLLSDNLRQQNVSIPLNGSVINGDWAFMTIERVAPAANEYSGFLYLTTVSVQYTRLVV